MLDRERLHLRGVHILAVILFIGDKRQEAVLGTRGKRLLLGQTIACTGEDINFISPQEARNINKQPHITRQAISFKQY